MDNNQTATRHANIIARVVFGLFFAGISAGMLGNGYYDFWYAAFIALAFSAVAYGLVYIGVTLFGGVSLPEIRVNNPAIPEEDGQPVDTEMNPESDSRFMHYANRHIQIPDTVKLEHLDIVREAKRRGDLPSVNTSRLNGIGISRFAAPPNASTVIEFLRRAGAIDEMGKWTAEGDKMFAPPTPINGRMHNVSV